MKRFVMLLLVAVWVCLPAFGLAETFIFPETLDGFIPNALDVLSVAPPNMTVPKNDEQTGLPMLYMSEEGEPIIVFEVLEGEPLTVTSIDLFVYDGEYESWEACALEKEEDNIYMPLTEVDGKQMLKDIENDIYPFLSIYCNKDEFSYQWIFLFESQGYEGHLYGEMNDCMFDICYQWDNELEPNYSVYVYGEEMYKAEYDPEGKLIK